MALYFLTRFLMVFTLAFVVFIAALKCFVITVALAFTTEVVPVGVVNEFIPDFAIDPLRKSQIQKRQVFE
jgi:hypothetical protein